MFRGGKYDKARATLYSKTLPKLKYRLTNLAANPMQGVVAKDLKVFDRMEQAVDWKVLGLERRWAGLRSFAPDRLPVYGFDPRVPGFFWFAGQGGYGIQTAPAAARLAAQLLLGLPRDAMTERLDAACYSPARFGP